MSGASRIVARLGPTNTGKTHAAVERILEHRSGAIALPLRLLAREVYDTMCARVGRDAVALVTGEERRIPSAARYFVSTTEALDVSRDVEIVAIDEVQLMAHGERGHVFTDRVMRARGRKETWLLGSPSARSLLERLAPTAVFEDRPRLSRLSYAGPHKLQRLPPRSAVVAFSMDAVYSIAERLRALRGGAALVLGALSPRTRNAQVAMFQAGEVDYLVATDAIGMGLNLAVDHVAFAGLRKFDGAKARALDDGELVQIAGRAGRYLRDGTFGTVLPHALSAEQIAAVERHQTAPLRAARYRNPELDFASLDALLASMAAPPPSPFLIGATHTEDARALASLAVREDVRARARGEHRLRLLADVARIPDFRDLLFEAHVEELAAIYVELVDRERLSASFFERALAPLRAPPPDVDSLVAMLARLRTWAYVANHPAWVEDATRWAAEARDLEDALSDALHAALVARFVTARRSTRTSAPHPRRSPARPEEQRLARDPHHPFAALSGLRVRGAATPLVAPPDRERSLEALVEAPHEVFVLEGDGTIVAGGAPIGVLSRGTSLDRPLAKLHRDCVVRAGLDAQLTRRLVAFARDVVVRHLTATAELEASDAPLDRAVAYALREGLGTARPLPATEASVAAGVVHGELATYVPSTLSREGLAVRRALVAAHRPGRRVIPPSHGEPTMARVDPTVARELGYLVLGPSSVRVDVAEALVQADAPAIASALATDAETAARIGDALRARARSRRDVSGRGTRDSASG